MRESIKQYLKATLQRWYWLVVSVTGGVLGTVSLTGFDLVIPSIGWFAILFVALSISQFCAFHDLRIKQSKNERELVRQSKIELANKQLSGLSDTLQAMSKELHTYVDGAHLKDIASEILEEVHPYMYKEYPSIYLEPKRWPDEEVLKYFLDFAAWMDTHGMGLTGMCRTDSWLKLQQQLAAYSIGDSLLIERIKEFEIILIGAQSYRLHSRYADVGAVSPQSHDEVHVAVRRRTSDQAMEVFIKRALAKVVERVNELLCGDL